MTMAAGCLSAPTAIIARNGEITPKQACKPMHDVLPPCEAGRLRAAIAEDSALLAADGLTKWYGRQLGCRNVSFEIYEGEVVAVVGESGSGKSTLLLLLTGQIERSAGTVCYRMRDGVTRDLDMLNEAERRFLARTDWGFVHQDPQFGLRMRISSGGNVGERLMSIGWRNYGHIRSEASRWFERVEIDVGRLDDTPIVFSGGMRQRLQIACSLVTQPRLIFMDEPTGSLDVSVQARLLDLLRGLVADLGVAVIIVTHDLGVARLFSHRIVVMKGGEVVETGLTDQVLEDPQQPYTQLLVSSILPV
jgi:putative phosphonate transport system ATP-binding protein